KLLIRKTTIIQIFFLCSLAGPSLSQMTIVDRFQGIPGQCTFVTGDPVNTNIVYCGTSTTLFKFDDGVVSNQVPLGLNPLYSTVTNTTLYICGEYVSSFRY